jgi:hypothetical protein
VDYAKLLEMDSFFTWHIFLQVDKTQDLPSKICQTLGVALTSGKAKATQTMNTSGFSNSNSFPSQVAILFFGKNRKTLLQHFPISGCHLFQVGKNLLRAHINARNDPRCILPY